jgi:Predicted hydrolases or acyltransferases (alpha/beta hydrolase superfamily)
METLLATDNHPIRYVSLGKGQPIVFLHGWTSGAREWLPFASELAESHQVFCWDARGHGTHEPPPCDQMVISQMAADLDRLLTEHDLRDTVLVGHSMGALISWEYIRSYGLGRLGGLCIIDQSPRLVTDIDWPLGIYGDFDYDAISASCNGWNRTLPKGCWNWRRTALTDAAARTTKPTRAVFSRCVIICAD